jgi:hypothetical protein
MGLFEVVGIIVLVVVGVAAVIGVLSQSGGRAVSPIKFEKCKVSPQFRCPGHPITVEWAASGKPVIITFDGKDARVDPPSLFYEIPASLVDAAPDDTSVIVKIDDPNGETQSFDIHTIRGVKKYQRRATVTQTAYKYQNEFPKEIWTDDILFIGVELIEPQSYVSEQGQTVGCDWQYDAGMTQSGTLNPINSFRAAFAPVKIDLARLWVFTLGNPPQPRAQTAQIGPIGAGTAPLFNVVVKCPA